MDIEIKELFLVLIAKIDNLALRVNAVEESLNNVESEVRAQGVRLDRHDGLSNILIDGYTALDKKIDDFRKEVHERFSEIDYKFDIVFKDIDSLHDDMNTLGTSSLV